MRVLLQNFETKEFFVSPGAWTRHIGQAADFMKQDHAASTARRLRLQNVEIHIATKDGTSMFAIPLHRV